MLPSIDHPAAPGRDASDLRRRRPIAVVAALAGLVLVLAGCVAPKNQTTVETPRADASESTGPLASFYDQELEWSSCTEGECATAQVPLDYADPSAGSIGIALARSKASGGDPLGSLLLNPGGPGASGVDFLEQAKGLVSKDVQKQYDLVSFDPRGVQRSNPVKCVDDAQLDELLAFDPDYSTDEGIQHVIDVYGDLGSECLKNTGAALGHVDTVSAARDLDILRSALGDDQLHYLGFSYGTELGATYAALFPTTVGRMVLDGALPPTLSSFEASKGQAAGFEGALRAYITDCQAGSNCPLKGSVEDGLTQVRRLLDRARVNPLPTNTDRDVTSSLAFYGIALPLYSKSSWGYLTQALDAAINKGDGSILLQLADFYSDREADGTYSTNSTVAFNAINCVDTPRDDDPDFDVMRDQAAADRGRRSDRRLVLRVRRHDLREVAGPVGAGAARLQRARRAADRRRRHHERPGHALPVVRAAHGPAVVGGPAHPRGRGPHGLRLLQRLHRRRGRHVPAPGHAACEGDALLKPGRQHRPELPTARPRVTVWAWLHSPRD